MYSAYDGLLQHALQRMKKLINGPSTPNQKKERLNMNKRTWIYQFRGHKENRRRELGEEEQTCKSCSDNLELEHVFSSESATSSCSEFFLDSIDGLLKAERGTLRMTGFAAAVTSEGSSRE